MLEDELWAQRVNTEVEIVIFRENQLVEETILLEEILKNKMREVQKELKKENNQVWKNNRVIYIKEKNLYFKQLENLRANIIEKSKTSRCRTFKITKNAQVN